MNLTTIQFGKAVYRLSEPQSGWFQRSVADAPECSQCGHTLTFTFAPRTNPAAAGYATSCMQPTGIRCDCSPAEKFHFSTLARTMNKLEELLVSGRCNRPAGHFWYGFEGIRKTATAVSPPTLFLDIERDSDQYHCDHFWSKHRQLLRIGECHCPKR